MFLWRAPSDDEINAYLQQLAREPLSYQEVGLTRKAQKPRGYDLAIHRVRLGFGKAAFQAAQEALRAWRMFPTSLAMLYWPSTPIEPGREVMVGFTLGPLWSLNPCRILYAIDEREGQSTGDHHRFGFAYATLPGHVEAGEERFLVTWDEATDEVCYEIFCYSRGQHILAKIGYPFVLYQQWRFRRLSGRAMQEAVRQSLSSDASRRGHASW